MSELERLPIGGPPSVRHARRGRRGPGGMIAGIIASIVVCALVATAAVGAVVWNTFSNALAASTVTISETDAPPPDLGAIEGGFNILIVGSDDRSCYGCDIDGSGDDGVLNDVNILLHVAQDQRSAVAVSLPRDLDINQYDTCAWSQLNTGIAAGGLPCVVDEIQTITGLPVQFAGLITFAGVINVSDAIGGVDICTTGPVQDPDGSGIDLPSAGNYTLQGYQALAFLRTRQGVGDGSDLGRISSQQVYLSSLVRKLKSGGVLDNLPQLFGLAQTMLQNMSLSQSLANPYTLIQLALVLKNLPLNRVTFVQWPTHYEPSPDGTKSLVETTQSAADQLTSMIAADQPFVLAGVGDDRGSTANPDGALTPEQQQQLADNSGLPTLEGVTGQTAADFSCSVPYQG